MKIINIIILLVVILSFSSCNKEDKENNNIFVPDFIENWQQNKEVSPEVIPTPTPIPTPIATPTPTPTPVPKSFPTPIKIVTADPEQSRIINNAQKYVGQTETDGFNRSPFIDKINEFAGVPVGSPYCASFVSYILYISEIRAPISAWSPDTTSKKNIPFLEINSADVFGLYFPSKGRIAHTGFIKEVKKNSAYILTTEANTSPNADELGAKSREGDGFFNKLRNKKLMADTRNKFSRYWK